MEKTKYHKDKNKLLRKTAMCKFFLLGKCERGSSCSWAHGTDELRASPDFRCTRFCKILKEGGCNDLRCPFAHSTLELRREPRPSETWLMPRHLPPEVENLGALVPSTAPLGLEVPGNLCYVPYSLNEDGALAAKTGSNKMRASVESTCSKDGFTSPPSPRQVLAAYLKTSLAASTSASQLPLAKKGFP
mmetsp:Transcript_28457/g.51430  ORF Transcript_28457/g.51430 Transcript_28457/m.51430 type:complete len:189 (-) Transcript_28457:111-677(-)